MKTAFASARAPAACARIRLTFFALVLAACLAVPVPAPAAETLSKHQPTPGLVLAAGTPFGSWAPAEWILGNQKRMLQVMTVAVVLGIWLILWRK
jgi:hypothetical protein